MVTDRIPVSDMIPTLQEGVGLYPHQELAIRDLLANNGSIVLAHSTGSGKTISSVVGFEVLRQMGKAAKALVVVPASLKSNYSEKGVKKFTRSSSQVLGAKGEPDTIYPTNLDPNKDYTIISYEQFREHWPEVLDKLQPDTLIVDEYHRARDPAGGTYKTFMQARSHFRNFIGMTGSIVNNDPVDIVPLLNIATAGKFNLTPTAFKSKFERKIARAQGFFGGSKYLYSMQGLDALKPAVDPWVNYISEKSIEKELPGKTIEEIKVPMSDYQQKLYDYALDELDPLTRYKIRQNLPVSEQEAGHIFAKAMKARQAANAVHVLDKRFGPLESSYATPKARKLLDDAEEHLKNTADGKVVMYSNFIRGGIDELAAGLKARNIPYDLYIGKGREVEGAAVGAGSRNKAVKDFNEGRTRVLLISGAGAEGLDLKDPTMFQSLDSHFNPEKILQAEGRVRRIKGLENRPESQRYVQIKRYFSVTKPGLLDKILGKRDTSIDEWVHNTAMQKHMKNVQFRKILEETGQSRAPKLRNILGQVQVKSHMKQTPKGMVQVPAYNRSKPGESMTPQLLVKSAMDKMAGMEKLIEEMRKVVPKEMWEELSKLMQTPEVKNQAFVKKVVKMGPKEWNKKPTISKKTLEHLSKKAGVPGRVGRLGELLREGLIGHATSQEGLKEIVEKGRLLSGILAASRGTAPVMVESGGRYGIREELSSKLRNMAEELAKRPGARLNPGETYPDIFQRKAVRELERAGIHPVEASAAEKLLKGDVKGALETGISLKAYGLKPGYSEEFLSPIKGRTKAPAPLSLHYPYSVHGIKGGVPPEYGSEWVFISSKRPHKSFTRSPGVEEAAIGAEVPLKKYKPIVVTTLEDPVQINRLRLAGKKHGIRIVSKSEIPEPLLNRLQIPLIKSAMNKMASRIPGSIRNLMELIAKKEYVGHMTTPELVKPIMESGKLKSGLLRYLETGKTPYRTKKMMFDRGDINALGGPEPKDILLRKAIEQRNLPEITKEIHKTLTERKKIRGYVWYIKTLTNM